MKIKIPIPLCSYNNGGLFHMMSKINENKCVIDIECTSFNPWEGRLICIGVLDVNNGETKVFQDSHEETLLIEFLKYYNKKDFQEIIGYNITYDTRFIFAKCLKYSIPANQFFSAYQTDVMMILKSVKKGFNFNIPGTLDEWSKSVLGRKKLFHNTEIPELFQQGRISDIIEYNIVDLEITYELWKRIRSVLYNEIHKKNVIPQNKQTIHHEEALP